MSKIDNKVINYIKLLGLDMLKLSSKEACLDNFNSASLFYTLYMNHLIMDFNNNDFINKDRVLLTNTFKESYYATLHFMGLIPLESIKEYSRGQELINDNSIVDNNILGLASGICYGEEYLESLIKKENNKSKLISFHTYVICK